MAKNATTQVTLNNAQTQVNICARRSPNPTRRRSKISRFSSILHQIRAPITGRISAANVKVGNFVRPADTAPLATINQISPIYVTFTVPQRTLPDVRQALADETATVEAHRAGREQARAAARSR